MTDDVNKIIRWGSIEICKHSLASDAQECETLGRFHNVHIYQHILHHELSLFSLGACCRLHITGMKETDPLCFHFKRHE
jgi:enoyl-[acyl-carrier-protein] reductase (NADH)